MKTKLFLLLALAFLLAPFAQVQVAAAASVTPTVVSGNPSCSSLVYGKLSFKPQPEPPPSGTYTFPGDSQNSVKLTKNGAYYSWISTISIDAVIVKGGPNSNVYVYNPESYGDTQLSAPDNGGQPYGLSHIEFCYDYELVVTKTANPTYTREYTWTIDKSVTPGTLDLFAGESSKADYSVQVDQTVLEKDPAVSGTITIKNPSPFNVTVTSVSDAMNGSTASVDCAPPFTLAGYATKPCNYSMALLEKKNGTNTATVATNSADVAGGSGTAAVAFGNPTQVVGYPTVNVTDSNGKSWSASGDATWTYDRTFNCSTTPSSYANGRYSYLTPNTATITQTGNSDGASVTVNCYAPLVFKDSDPTYTREYTWKIDKSVNQNAFGLFAGETGTAKYTVAVDQTVTDKDFKVFGDITVVNSHPSRSMTVAVADSLPGATGMTLSCNGSLTVAARQSAACHYDATVTNADKRLNTATVTFNSIKFVATADVIFGAPKIVGFSTVNVTDTNRRNTSWQATGDASWSYDYPFTCPTSITSYSNGKYSFTLPNTATITENGLSDRESVTWDCYAPVVSKTSDPTYTREYSWTIDKSVSPSELWMFAGESGGAHYNVSVDQTYGEKLFVFGTITVTNTHPTRAMAVSVADNLPGAIGMTLTCNGALNVPANSSATCNYNATVSSAESRTNTATVTLGTAQFTATAPVVFGEPQEVGYGTVNVTDTNGKAWQASNDARWEYEGTFVCPSDPSKYANGVYTFTVPNTAKITETQQSDNASVKVNCYAPLVSKNAQTSFTRKYNWTILKAATQPTVTLSMGQVFPMTYTVTVNATPTNSDWAVKGTITVANPNPKQEMVVSVADELTGATGMTLDCGGSLRVPAGGRATCGYSAGLPGSAAVENTAKATLNSIGFSGKANVVFDLTKPTKEVDKCIDVNDSLHGSLGRVCYSGAAKLLTYNHNIGPYSVCGDYTVNNEASFTASDTGAKGSASASVAVKVPCLGCTLTPGYWKTHSNYGPARYDDTWAKIGEDTEFYLSKTTWYKALWVSPSGNAYWILAHAYIAAKLNTLNGADYSAVAATLARADGLLKVFPPTGKMSKSVRAEFVATAGILDKYNNGYIGPGHCSE